MSKPRVWLLSAYAAVSHRVWADHRQNGLANLDWQRFELPPRHSRWRIRASPLSWLDVLPGRTPDLIGAARAGVVVSTTRHRGTTTGAYPAGANGSSAFWLEVARSRAAPRLSAAVRAHSTASSDRARLTDATARTGRRARPGRAARGADSPLGPGVRPNRRRRRDTPSG